MTVAHTNFYENHKEATMRLRGTVVLYDELPFYIFAICAHKPDGIFRVYMQPLGLIDPRKATSSGMPDYSQYHYESADLGPYLDNWMTANPGKIERKMMNSPLFKKFRPFPLGMVNQGAKTYYVERSPVRKTEQGLVNQMLEVTPVTLGPKAELGRLGRAAIEMFSPSFRACILGDHPSAQESIKNLISGDYENEAVAFDREMAFVKGPIDLIFLAYKGEVIGSVTHRDLSVVKLGREFKHFKEVVEAKRVFTGVE